MSLRRKKLPPLSPRERLTRHVREVAHPSTDGIDVHYFHVWVTDDTMPDQDFYDLVVQAVEGSGEFENLTLDQLRGGQSYITLGGWLGDQQLALAFMGLCEFHGLCTVITPAKVGATGEHADEMAGLGFVLMSGFSNPTRPPTFDQRPHDREHDQQVQVQQQQM